ncbi:MAG: OmpA family protein, partial [Beijerinckiaceae bacterium]|nr:OmpA family protein [Beijerinckiaceae bacterium]
LITSIKNENEKKDLEIKIENLNKELKKLKASMRDPLETYLKQVSDARRKLLEQLRNSLNADFPDIPNLMEKLTEQSDALRFEGDGLFIKGKDIFVSQQKEDIIKQLAIRLNEILPCYTFTATARSELKCENPNIAIIEAVQVEGHTDSDGSYKGNIELSATRATTTFKLMIETVPGLREFKNSKDQAVMSFAGYGPDRPIATNNTEKEKAKNRRIDLRFIMVTPSSIAEMETIRTKFIDLQVK